MISETKISEKNIADYEEFLSKGKIEKLKRLAADLQGKFVMHVNATPRGGGVAEILASLVPLQRSLGIDSRWFHIESDAEFFDITKKLHNALQGSGTLTAEQEEYYLEFNRRLARHVNGLKPDLLVVHDPQPLAAAGSLENITAILRIHIDLTTPDQGAISLISPFFDRYKKITFIHDDYIPNIPGLRDKTVVSPLAIDPLSPKNTDMPQETARKICENLGIDCGRPFIVQVSRFDPWKDPLGVIKAYRIVKRQFPRVQLALAGVVEAQDDPEALEILKMTEKFAEGDPDIFLFSRLEQLQGTNVDVFVNALQCTADVVVQKSLREGFGLVVAEAMWKRKAVVGGNAGGIRLQIQNGKNGYLVDSAEEAAAKIIGLLSDSGRAKKMGERARETIKKKFLIVRLLEDELETMRSAMNGGAATSNHAKTRVKRGKNK